MAVNLSLVILLALLVNIPNCSTDNPFPFKWEDFKGDYMINIYYTYERDALCITHDDGLVVIDLITFPTQDISQKLGDNNLKFHGIFIEKCTLPDGDSFGILFKHLGIETEIVSFEGINISPQQFSLDGRFSSGFEKVKSLTLSENNIIKLNESVFESLTELTHLYLSANNITEVNPNVFKKLTKLESLDMSDNGLKSLSEGMFDNQKELTTLELSENKLTSLTRDVFRGLYSLKHLYLGGNAVSLMDHVFDHLPQLKYISLGGGNVKLPYAIFANRSQLEDVYLEQVNVVDGLQLSGLEILQIESSKVMNRSGLSDIKTVKIKNCELSSLNMNSFKSLNSTKRLHLPSNNITNLVDGLFNGLTKLVLLRLPNNQLKYISGLIFRELDSLTNIDLSNNILTTIHANAFDNNKRLTHIRLKNNRLSFKDEKTPFMHVYSLELLDLSQNYLTRVPDLLKLDKLEDLHLNDNTISSVHFSEIRSYVIIFGETYAQHFAFGDRNTRMFLNGNTLESDYGMYDFLSGTDQKELASVFGQECDFSPHSRHGFYYSIIECDYLCSQQIEDEYYCHITLSCKGSKLTEMPNIDFINATSITLDISNNNLNEFAYIDPRLNITFIQASFNHISKIGIETLPSTLRGLDLSHNQFRTIAAEVLLHVKDLKNLEVFFLKNNPLECYCSSDTEQLIRFADESSTTTDLQNAKCNVIYDLSTKTLKTICRHELIVISLTIVTIVVMIFVVILLLSIKYHKFVKMWLYAHGWFLWWVDEEYVDREKVYDVFISYEHTNRLLAFRIMYALEKCNIFKVCLHERDFPGGERIEESVNNAVRDSRRTLVILSENYLKSALCEHEFHLAWDRCVAEKRKLIVAVKDGDLGNVTDKIIRSYIETHTYVELGDKWFFERIIFRLPHKRAIKNVFPIRE